MPTKPREINDADHITASDVVSFIVNLRAECRRVIQILDGVRDDNHSDGRRARKLRQSGSQMLARMADTLEVRINKRCAVLKSGHDLLRTLAVGLIQVAPAIDTLIPRPMLLDLLGVNHVDRHALSDSDGLMEIVAVHKLEDSAMRRGMHVKDGPFGEAITAHMCHQLIHDDVTRARAHNLLFGKGGMLEFIPTYKQDDVGRMIRMPPKLRLAGECDLNAGRPDQATAP